MCPCYSTSEHALTHIGEYEGEGYLLDSPIPRVFYFDRFSHHFHGNDKFSPIYVVNLKIVFLFTDQVQYPEFYSSK